MANEKKVFNASDAAPAVMYAKQDASSEKAYPLVANTEGSLHVDITNEQTTGDFYNNLSIVAGGVDHLGLVQPIQALPIYDEKVLAYTSGDLTSVTYKYGGTTVAVKTLTYTSGDLTGVTIA